MKKLYKFLDAGLKSHSGDCVWKLDEWKKETDIDICNKGFHASKTPLQALSYVYGEIVAEVEVKGKSIIEDDKEYWSEMRIVKAYHWTKKDSVSLAIFSAELVLENFEKKYPDDKRPRNAIEAAKKVFIDDTEENRSAWSAARSAAESAWSAWSAAESAARSAARSAAKSAAWSAESAESAWSAKSAAAVWIIARLLEIAEKEVKENEESSDQ